MKKTDISPERLAARRVFIDRLSDAGWDVEPQDELLDAGIDVEPEAEATFTGPVFDLRLEYHAEGFYVMLEMDQREGELGLTLRMHPAREIRDVLDRIVAVQDVLNADNMGDIVKSFVPLCDPLLLETDEGVQQLSE
jgi:hypothetical protein